MCTDAMWIGAGPSIDIALDSSSSGWSCGRNRSDSSGNTSADAAPGFPDRRLAPRPVRTYIH